MFREGCLTGEVDCFGIRRSVSQLFYWSMNNKALHICRRAKLYDVRFFDDVTSFLSFYGQPHTTANHISSNQGDLRHRPGGLRG